MASPAAMAAGFACVSSAAGVVYYGVNVAKVFGGALVSRLTCPIDPRVGRVRIDECKVGDDADSHQTVRCADGPIHLLAEGCGPGKMTEGSGCILFVMMQHSFHSNPPLIAPNPTILSSQ